jgi:hypothetical protein
VVDARHVRLLPWAKLHLAVKPILLLTFPALSLALFVVPNRLVRRLVRERTWRAALALLGWLLVLPAGLWLVVRYDLLAMGIAPWGTVLIMCFAAALGGFVLLAPVALAAKWAWQRQWRRVVLLGALFAAVTVAVVVVYLRIDAPAREPDDFYAMDGWHHVFKPAYLILGLLVLVGVAAAGTGRRLRRRFGRAGDVSPPVMPPPGG